MSSTRLPRPPNPKAPKRRCLSYRPQNAACTEGNRGWRASSVPLGTTGVGAATPHTPGSPAHPPCRSCYHGCAASFNTNDRTLFDEAVRVRYVNSTKVGAGRLAGWICHLAHEPVIARVITCERGRLGTARRQQPAGRCCNLLVLPLQPPPPPAASRIVVQGQASAVGGEKACAAGAAALLLSPSILPPRPPTPPSSPPLPFTAERRALHAAVPRGKLQGRQQLRVRGAVRRVSAGSAVPTRQGPAAVLASSIAYNQSINQYVTGSYVTGFIRDGAAKAT